MSSSCAMYASWAFWTTRRAAAASASMKCRARAWASCRASVATMWATGSEPSNARCHSADTLLSRSSSAFAHWASFSIMRGVADAGLVVDHAFVGGQRVGGALVADVGVGVADLLVQVFRERAKHRAGGAHGQPGDGGVVAQRAVGQLVHQRRVGARVAGGDDPTKVGALLAGEAGDDQVGPVGRLLRHRIVRAAVD